MAQEKGRLALRSVVFLSLTLVCRRSESIVTTTTATSADDEEYKGTPEPQAPKAKSKKKPKFVFLDFTVYYVGCLLLPRQ